MIHLELDAARIFVRPGATDMRKQINGLVLLVQEQMQLSPFEAALFVFCNAQRRVLKAVYWDRTGFCLWCCWIADNFVMGIPECFAGRRLGVFSGSLVVTVPPRPTAVSRTGTGARAVRRAADVMSRGLKRGGRIVGIKGEPAPRGGDSHTGADRTGWRTGSWPSRSTWPDGGGRPMLGEQGRKPWLR